MYLSIKSKNFWLLGLSDDNLLLFTSYEYIDLLAITVLIHSKSFIMFSLSLVLLIIKSLIFINFVIKIIIV